MNKVILLVLVILLLGLPESGLGQITDDFETGDISRWIQSPENHWSIDNVSPISGNFSLHHSFDNPESGVDRTGLPLKLRPGDGTSTWKFRIRYAYDPSSSNNWVVFLMSDIGPESFQESSAPSGFAVGVNQNDYSDTIQLWKVIRGKFITLAKSKVNWQTDISPSNSSLISVERSSSGIWSMNISKPASGMPDVSYCEDSELFDPAWFVLSYRYTASRDMLLWFDDLYISGVFGEGPPSPQYAQPCAGDIVFTEIMAKPVPALSLPGKEYLEIFNRTSTDLTLKDLQLCTTSQSYPFPDIILKGGEFLVLCQSEDTAMFSVYGRTAGFRSFPALTDAGRIIAITDNSGNLIDGIEYSSKWYGDDLKSDGGWSLEIIDNRYPFSGENNWKASQSGTGGTPGNANSVSAENPDLDFFGIENVYPEDSGSVDLRFSETVPAFQNTETGINVDHQRIKSIGATDLLLKDYRLELSEPLIPGKINELTIDTGVKDFAGNAIRKNIFRFGLPFAPDYGDIQFNEILFNPFPGEPDFIELANCSDKIVDANDLKLVSVNDETRDTSSAVFVSSEHRCILPGDLYVITTDRKKLTDRFFSSDAERIFEVSGLPSMPDDKGHLILLNRKLEKVDEVAWSQKMHFPLLQSFEGISLEKVRPEAPSKVSSNWNSASEASGWGTPGARNSIFSDNPETTDVITFSSGKITPDNDGNDDLLVIDLKPGGSGGKGSVVSVWIFDETGIIVKKLTDNMLVGPETSIVWNGTANDENLVSTGIYILLIRIFDDSGHVRTWKKVCTVIRN